MPKERGRKTHYPSWHHIMQRLEQQARLHLQLARAVPRMFRMRQQGSRSSGMPSSAEKDRLSLLIRSRLGIIYLDVVIYLSNTLISLVHCKRASMLAYGPFISLPHLLIAPLCFFIPKLTGRWLPRNSTKAVISVHARVRRSSHFSAPFNPPLCRGSLNPANPVSTGQYIIFRTHIPQPLRSPPLIPPSTQTPSRAPGAPLLPSASLYTTSLPDCRQQSRTLLRPIVPFPLSLSNGRAWLSGYLATMCLPSTLATI